MKILVYYLKGVTETILNEAKQKKGGFHSMLLGTLGASILASKGMYRTEKEFIRVGNGSSIKNKDF